MKKLSFFATDFYQMLSSLAKDKLIDYIECMKLSSYAKKLGIHYNTAYRMFRKLVVVNTADNEEPDLMGDFVAIITSFAARLYWRRRAKRKTEQVLAALQQNGDGHEPEASKRN